VDADLGGRLLLGGGDGARDRGEVVVGQEAPSPARMAAS
jgi:hypothetical protein